MAPPNAVEGQNDNTVDPQDGPAALIPAGLKGGWAGAHLGLAGSQTCLRAAGASYAALAMCGTGGCMQALLLCLAPACLMLPRA